MPKRSCIATLPADVLSELNRRLVETNFSGYVVHAEWLTNEGHDIGKSAMHRYGQFYQEELLAEVKRDKNIMMPFRMRCLELAVQLGAPSDPAELYNKAEELLNWVRAV